MERKNFLWKKKNYLKNLSIGNGNFKNEKPLGQLNKKQLNFYLGK